MTEEHALFGLRARQVPGPPESGLYADRLRWCVIVMDSYDNQLGFAASLLSYAIENDGLTKKQARYADKMFERVVAQHQAKRLECQEPGLEASHSPARGSGQLHLVEPEEGA